MNDVSRIVRFEKMVEADPDNELGHFSLGKEYLDARRYQDAIGPLTRTLELNPNMSKAYQLLGEAYGCLGQRDKAVEIVTRGIRLADELGDRQPRDAMASMLARWDAPIPASGAAAQTAPAQQDTQVAPTTGFKCARCGRPDARLAQPPFKGALGETVYASTCEPCWSEWVRMGTKVINELGLVLSSQAGQDTYDEYMTEFLQLERS